MSKKFLILILMLVVIFIGTHSVGAQSNENTPENIQYTGNYVVQGQENLQDGYVVKDSLKIGNETFYVVKPTGYNSLNTESKGGVSKEKYYRVTGSSTDDVRSNIENINASGVPNLRLGQENINIGVIDSGVNDSHPYIDDVVWNKDFRNSKSNPKDNHGHGTHIAGIIAADYNSGNKVRGVSPSMNIYNLKALNDSGVGTTLDIAKAIAEGSEGPDGVKGTEDDADVLSLSLGAPSSSRTIAQAIEYATPGTTIVVAAGNMNGGDVLYPAAYNNTTAVSSVNSDLSPSRFSSTGKEVDVAAPGNRILSLDNDGGYTQLSGTSMSTPHVSAVAGLTIAEKGGTNSEVQERLKNTATDIHKSGPDDATGFGIVNVNKLIDAIDSFKIGKIYPELDTLRQKKIDFSFDITGDKSGLTKEYDIVGPGESTNYQEISSTSFTEDLSKYSGGDTITVKVRVSDSSGDKKTKQKEYNIYEDKTPPIKVTQFSTNSDIFIGQTNDMILKIKNEDSVRNDFKAKIIRDDSIIGSISTQFSPSEERMFSFKDKPNKVKTSEYSVKSSTHNIAVSNQTTEVKDPLEYSMELETKEILKTKSFNVVVNIEQKEGVEFTPETKAILSFDGNEQKIDSGVGDSGLRITRSFATTKEGNYNVNLSVTKPSKELIQDKITVNCIGRRFISRGKETVECSYDRDIGKRDSRR